jgi:WD40 repeat protein
MQLERTLEGHPGAVRYLKFGEFGDAASTVSSYSGAAEAMVRTWDLASGELQGEFPDLFGVRISGVFSPDEKVYAVVDATEIVLLDSSDSSVELNRLRGHSDAVNKILFSADGSLLASASDDRTVRLWDVGTGRQLSILRGHTDSVFAIAFSPDGGVLASAGFDGTVRLWDAANGRLLTQVTVAPYLAVIALDFSSDGELLAAGSIDHVIRLWGIRQ